LRLQLDEVGILLVVVLQGGALLSLLLVIGQDLPDLLHLRHVELLVESVESSTSLSPVLSLP